MSNFTCPTCGLTNIDCGKAGYKTRREIELEKKLKIAIKALEFYAEMGHIDNVVACSNIKNHCWCEGDIENGYVAEKALAKIKEIK